MFKLNPVLGFIIISFGVLVVGEGNAIYSTDTSISPQPQSYQNAPAKLHCLRLGNGRSGGIVELPSNFLMNLTDARAKTIITKLFNKHGKLKAVGKTLENYSLAELGIVNNDDSVNGVSVCSALDKTETAAGSAVLSALLSNPVSDLSVIKKRQTIVQFLLENDAIFNELDRLLKGVKEGQNSLLNCWNEEANLDANMRSVLYSPKNSRFAFLNKSAKYHQLNKIASYFTAVVSSLGLPSAFIGLIAFPIASAAALATGQIQESAGLAGLTVLAGFMILIQRQYFNNCRLMHRTVFNIHQRLRHISKLTESIDDIFYVVRDHKPLRKTLSLVNNMSDFVIDPQSVSKDLYHLKDMLSRSLFEQEKFGVFSHAGTVIAAYGYMQEAQDAYIVPLEAIGEIDACLSIAKVIKEHQLKKSTFCFVDFVEQAEPFMKLQEAWNVVVGSGKAKSMNIVLGGQDNPKNAMITGPVYSGKSTLVQTIASCDILGRTFGIAPAKKATMTMFDDICSFVNVKENKELGRSSYRKERERGVEIVNYIKNNPTKKILAVIDAPYNGIINESGEILSHDFAAAVAQYSNVVCVMASNHKTPTDLAETGKFANYHLDVSENTLNDFDRTFNLLPGKCDWWFNDVAKRSRYIKSCD